MLLSTRLRTARGPAAAIATIALCVSGVQAELHTARADTAPPSGTPATVSADALPTWQVNGVVWSMVVVGSTVYATGSFTKARPPGTSAGSSQEVARANLLAFNIATGNLTSFKHSLNGQGLRVARSPDGSRVYVGGDFTTVDGKSRRHLVAFSTATGALVSSFAPSVSGRVSGIAATNSRVFFGGNFSSVNGSARTSLAAVSASSGATISTWKPKPDGGVTAMVLSPDASRVIVGGHFTKLNGVAAYGMGSLSATTGATGAWAANKTIRDGGPNGAITSLTADATLIYGAGYAFGSGANFEGTFAAAPISGTIEWLNDCHGDTYDVRAIGQVAYSVSHAHDCSAIGQFPETSPRTWHHALATTTYASGTNKGPDSYGWNYDGIPAAGLLHWYPSLAIGSYTGQYQAAWAVTGTSNYVVLGGEFPKVEGKAQQGLTRFAVSSIAPNKTGPIASGWTAPSASALSGGKVKLTWRATWDHDNNRLTYQVLRDGESTPIFVSAPVKSSFWILPTLTFTDSGLASGSSHTYQIRAVDPFGNTATSPTSSAVTVTVAALDPYADAVLRDGASDYWIDEVAIYAKPLTASQIAAHYQIGMTAQR
jgi:trimeric autotransporter adhesin